MNTQRRGLEVVFTIFLGILVATFIGAGVYTFYPPPQAYDDEIDTYWDARRDLLDGRPQTELSDDEKLQLRQLDDHRNMLMKETNKAVTDWARTSSIILIALATGSMVLSLLRPDRLPVVSSGLLLGGVFTMLYGMVWNITAGTAMTRFVVITIALIVTLALGYARFVRRQAAPASVTVPAGDDASRLDEFTQRLDAIEKRLDELADGPNKNGS